MLVREHAGDYRTEWGAIIAAADRLGMSGETLRKWIRQAEVDEGGGAGSPAASPRRSASCAGGTRAGANHRNTQGGHEFFVRECDPLRR